MQPSLWNDERITAYVMGELSPSESAQLEAEMNANPEIAKAVEEARNITAQLASMFAAEPPMSLDAIKRNQIREASPSSTVGLPLDSHQRNGSPLRYLVLAATVLLTVSLGVVAYQRQMPWAVTNEVAMETAEAQPSTEVLEALAAKQSVDLQVERSLGRDAVKKELAVGPQEFSTLSMDKGAEMVAPPAPAEALSSSSATPMLSKEPMVSRQQRTSQVPRTPLPEPAGEAMGMDMGMAMSGGMGGGVATDASQLYEEEMAQSPFSPYFGANSLPASEPQIFLPSGSLSPQTGDRFEVTQETGFKRVSEAPLSTFSIDVDTASYSKARQFILQSGILPPAGSIRIEELVNYFDYDYEPPAADSEHPFAARVEVATCPWKPEHRLARIAIKGREVESQKRPDSNLVFLVDTSGSMSEWNKLPLVKQGLQKLVNQLGERDRVAIVVYAGSAGLVLDSTPATERSAILRRINQMQSGGSTNGGQGIRLAYQVARDHFINDGTNRVILCSDGDFNVGTTSDAELVELVEKEAKGGIDLTVLGFGMGNHNDSMMEKISGKGNGNYAFIDSEAEANRVLVEQLSSTLMTIARDVKIQVEFNPAEVAAYRLIGYENRRLENEDFKDDTKDAGEIGAGHSVTALYELIPAVGDLAAIPPAVDELRYQKKTILTESSKNNELMTLKLRYKNPSSDTSIPVEFPVDDHSREFTEATEDLRFATAVAGFGMLLQSSEHSGNWTFRDVEQVAANAKGQDPHGLRAEFIEMVKRAAELRTRER
jgi:Ca-activated chloride channel family protein